jgi:hypothetical protein
MKQVERMIGGVDVVLRIGDNWSNDGMGYRVMWAVRGDRDRYLRTNDAAGDWSWATGPAYPTEEDAIKAAYQHIAAWVK